MEIINSFPKLDQKMIKQLEESLSERFDYPALPKDYIDFLIRHNGGFVTPGHIQRTDKEINKEEVVFKSPLKQGQGHWEPSIYAFFGSWMPNFRSKSMVKDASLPDLVASNEHLKHEYSILPENMMAIASCTLPNAGDLLCIGLDEENYGAVYFFFSQWFNPAFTSNETYYKLKTSPILDKYQLDSIYQTSISVEARYEIDRIPFIKVGDSFAEFLRTLKTKTVDY